MVWMESYSFLRAGSSGEDGGKRGFSVPNTGTIYLRLLERFAKPPLRFLWHSGMGVNLLSY